MDATSGLRQCSTCPCAGCPTWLRHSHHGSIRGHSLRCATRLDVSRTTPATHARLRPLAARTDMGRPCVPSFSILHGCGNPPCSVPTPQRCRFYFENNSWHPGEGSVVVFLRPFPATCSPHVLNPQPTATTWGTALLGFVVMFFIFLRLPQTWPHWARLGCRGVGWAGAASLLALLRYPDGSGFSLERSDIIIVVLANVAISGSLL